jgi:hypothetical protein
VTNSVAVHQLLAIAKMRGMKGLVPVALAFLASCDDTPGKWSLYIYPDARDAKNWERTDRFKTEGMCRRAAEEGIAKLPEPKKAAWRCAKLEPI